MEHKPAKSGNVKSYAFEDGVIEVKFHSGATHQYQANSETYDKLQKAKSLGGFVHSVLKKLPNRKKGEDKWRTS